MMYFTSFLLVLNLILHVNGWAVEPRELFRRETIKCVSSGPVNRAIKTIEASSLSEAALFCTSYLPINPKTVTHIVHPTETLTFTTVTATVTRSVATVTKTARVSTCSLDAGASPAAASSPEKRELAARADPVPEPSILSKFSPAQVTRVCHCLRLPTPTVTTTKTAGVTSRVKTTVSIAKTKTNSVHKTTITSTHTVDTCPAPTLCNNQGLQYAAFANDQGANTDTSYSNYDPAYMKAASVGGQGPSNLYYNSTTTTIGGIISGCPNQDIDIYNATESIPCLYFSLNHRGYLYAPVAGTYTIQLSAVDDICFVWSGAIAKTGWTRANADLEVSFNQGTNSPGAGSVSYNLRAGQYFPLRIVFGQGDGGAAFEVAAVSPSGTQFLNSSSVGSPYVVRHSCGKQAPPFPFDFGYEK